MSSGQVPLVGTEHRELRKAQPSSPLCFGPFVDIFNTFVPQAKELQGYKITGVRGFCFLCTEAHKRACFYRDIYIGTKPIFFLYRDKTPLVVLAPPRAAQFGEGRLPAPQRG